MIQGDEDSSDRMSPLPVSSRATRHGSLPDGWVPSHEDSSPAATDWRARKALSMVYEERTWRLKLAKSIDTLSNTIQTWQAEGKRRWEVSGKIAWGLGLPLVLAILLAIGTWLVRWLVTLHH